MHMFFSFVTPQVLPVREIIIGNISHWGGGEGPSLMFNLRNKNRLKVSFLLYQLFASPCNFQRKLPITIIIHQMRKKYMRL